MLYLNFTFSAAMLAKGEVKILKKDLTAEEAGDLIARNKIKICANPSHRETFETLKERYKIDLEVPLKPMKFVLKKGDELIVAQIVNLPRLTEYHQYDKNLMKKARIRFMLIKIF